MTREEAKKMVEAKLQCMERDVSGKDDDCNNQRCYECPLNYEQGNMGEQKEWLRMAIEALEQTQWIPCSKRLPEDSGDYLVCPSNSVLEDYSDFSEVMIMPYDADCEAFGWWTERYDPISLGFVDSDFNEFEVLAWMPLPKPYVPDTNVGSMSENPTGSEPQEREDECIKIELSKEELPKL